MALKCGVCGNKERFSASAELKLDVTVNCDGMVIAHDVDRILAELSLRPAVCAECGSRQLVESEYISDQEWDAQISQALEARRMDEGLKMTSLRGGSGRRQAS